MPTTSSSEFARGPDSATGPRPATRSAASASDASAGNATICVRGGHDVTRILLAELEDAFEQAGHRPRRGRPSCGFCWTSIRISSGECTRSSSGFELLMPRKRQYEAGADIQQEIERSRDPRKHDEGRRGHHRLVASG